MEKLNVSVRQMTSNRTGEEVRNQFIITTINGNYFQSYQTVIAYRDNSGNIQLDRDSWDYSKTTGKYRNQFLGETKKETEAKIASGVYKLVNLN